MSGLRSAREAVTALTPARAATSESVVRRRLPSLFPRAILPTSSSARPDFFLIDPLPKAVAAGRLFVPACYIDSAFT